MIIRDILYGGFEIPDELEPFLRLPEFVRLRGVRLSNVDSIEFKDLNGPSRWEHSVGVLHLASVCADARGLSLRERYHLQLAALLHDVATPPFAHTGEYVLDDFDHELESSRLLAGTGSQDVAPAAALYLSQVARFHAECRHLSHRVGVEIDPDEVARMVVGEGDLGFLIAGTLDLDNADNVTRASLYMGFDVDRSLPVRLAGHLASEAAAPLDLDQSPNGDFREWVGYRRRMYRAFFESSLSERAREAALQHLFRQAVVLGVPRRALVWNTDEGFLSLLERFSSDAEDYETAHPIREAVRRYRLLEEPWHVLSLDIETDASLRILQSAAATAWMEAELASSSCESLVTVTSRRYSEEDGVIDAARSAGQFHWFKSGSSISAAMLPEWLRAEVPDLSGDRLKRRLQAVLASRLVEWSTTKPWAGRSVSKTARVRDRLEEIGDWGFRQSRNAVMHSHPSTFVQAIPATLIHALGVAGDVVMDPFGGIGNTALEAARAGGWGVSGDSNTVACLIARVRSRFLDRDRREQVRDASMIFASDLPEDAAPPTFPLAEKWHHPGTASELARLRRYVSDVGDVGVREFLLVCLSSVLPQATERRGEQHGFFADNTPLPRGVGTPRYIDAVALFRERVRRNLNILEGSYAGFERDGRRADEELSRVSVFQADVCSSQAADYGLREGGVGAIITSPPYLGMSDYTLGHRLSYEWLWPDRMSTDFSVEVGSRRLRLRMGSDERLERYLDQMENFGRMSGKLLRPGGYLAMVIGKPVARAFEDVDILGMVDSRLEFSGFAPVWHTWRSISWSRNHAYAKLKVERISVHQLER